MSGNLLKILFFLIIAINHCQAEDFLVDNKPIHPLCIAQLIPSITNSEADYTDTVNIDNCKKSELQVTTKQSETYNDHIINYKDGSFHYRFIGNLNDYSLFETISLSSTAMLKNIVIAKQQGTNLILHDVITSGKNCNGFIMLNMILNNQLVIGQMINPALFLSIATDKEDVKGLEKFSQDGCLGIAMQTYNINDKNFNLDKMMLDNVHYIKASKPLTPQQTCFDNHIHGIKTDTINKQQSQDLAHNILSSCLMNS